MSQCNGGRQWDEGAPAGDTATVINGSNTPVPATLTQAGGIAGTARSSSGDALTDVTVSAFTASGAPAATARSGYDGSYALTSLPAGAYRLCWSGAQSVDASTGSGYGSGCFGATGSWSGGAPLAGSSLDVQTGQLAPRELSLAPVSSGAHVGVRTAGDAAAASERNRLPISVARRLAQHGGRTSIIDRPAWIGICGAGERSSAWQKSSCCLWRVPAFGAPGRSAPARQAYAVVSPLTSSIGGGGVMHTLGEALIALAAGAIGGGISGRMVFVQLSRRSESNINQRASRNGTNIAGSQYNQQ